MWYKLAYLPWGISIVLVWRELLTLSVSGLMLYRALCSTVRSCAEMGAVSTMLMGARHLMV